MKRAIGIFVIILILLCCSLCSYAAEGDYIVNFIEGFHPENFKTVISRKNGVYLFEDEDDFALYSEFIESVAPDGKVFLDDSNIPELLTVRDEYYSEQWNMKLINAEYAWNLETYGNDIKVAVIDSGCYPHPDLIDNLLPGKSYIASEPTNIDGVGHGTHVCGIIAAHQDEVGVTGVAPKSKIVPLKAFDSVGDTNHSYLSEAIYDAVDIFDCKIINMSWRTGNNNSGVYDAIKYAAEKGVILIAAAGNDGNENLYYPAGYEEVISVASVEKNKEQSDFSQRNSSVDIAAPGGYTLSTYKDDKYYFMAGTSQAAPVVAGIAAVALSADSSITREEFKKMLINTAEDLGEEGYDINYGYGLVSMSGIMNEIMKKKDYYISPINTDGSPSFFHFRNNTDETLLLGNIYAMNKDGVLTYVDIEQAELPFGTGININLANKGEEHYLWNMKTFAPLR